MSEIEVEPSTLGAILRGHRERLGMLQSEVEERAGLAHTRVSQYETGYRVPTLRILVKLADVYRVSLDSLVGRTINKDTGYER